MHLWQKSVVLNRETLESREKNLGEPSLLLKKCLFIYLRLAGLSLSFCARCPSSERAALCCGAGFSLWWFFLLQSLASRVQGLQQLWPTGLVALWHVESSQIRDQIHVPCIGRQILNHWTTRKV